jgi:hypothetical protein
MARTLREVLSRCLRELRALPVPELLERRYRKFRSIGQFRFAEAVEPERAAAPASPANASPAGP